MTAQTCPATFVSVHDGDTAHLDVVTASSDVFHEAHWTIGRRYRFARINAPELATPAGVASAAALTGKCATYPPTGWTVVTARQDPYGRYIAEVIAPDGTNLSDWQVAQGNAVPVHYGLGVERDGEADPNVIDRPTTTGE